MRKVLMIDNFDSFTYNLVQGFASLGSEIAVYRNNAITIEEAKALAPDFLVVSPVSYTHLTLTTICSV